MTSLFLPFRFLLRNLLLLCHAWRECCRSAAAARFLRDGERVSKRGRRDARYVTCGLFARRAPAQLREVPYRATIVATFT